MIGFAVQIAQAGTFTLGTWRGHDALLFSGEIEDGDQEIFEKHAQDVPNAPHGIPILLLDSPGGSVVTALEISRTMRRWQFHTVIPNYATCASACASILFTAGKYRTIEDFGRFGQHSCSLNDADNELCNEIIAEHALENGISHGSIAAFLNNVPSSDIIFLSREDIDGLGITRYPFEMESGFEKSEPVLWEIISGRTPPAQAAWRIDFHEDGYKAFLRPFADHKREMQINLFCVESSMGRLFLSMEILGSVETAVESIININVSTDIFGWVDDNPLIWQKYPGILEVISEIPTKYIIDFLENANNLSFQISIRRPFEPMIATTYLHTSRRALIFAANNCASGNFQGRRAPIHYK